MELSNLYALRSILAERCLGAQSRVQSGMLQSQKRAQAVCHEGGKLLDGLRDRASMVQRFGFRFALPPPPGHNSGAFLRFASSSSLSS